MTLQQYNERLIEALQDKAGPVEPQASLLSTLAVINGRVSADHELVADTIVRVERMMKLETVREKIGRALERHGEDDAELVDAWAITHDIYMDEHDSVEGNLDLLVQRR